MSLLDGSVAAAEGMDGDEALPEQWLRQLEADDRLFPLIQPLDWSKTGI